MGRRVATAHGRRVGAWALGLGAIALWSACAGARPPTSLLVAGPGTIQGDISLSAQTSRPDPFLGLTMTPHLSLGAKEWALAPDIAVRTGLTPIADLGLRLGASGAQLSSRIALATRASFGLATEPRLLLSQRSFRVEDEFGVIGWGGCSFAEVGAPLLMTADLSDDIGLHVGPSAAIRFELDCSSKVPVIGGATAALSVRVIPGFRIAVGFTAAADLWAISRIHPNEGLYAIAHLTFSTTQ